MPATAPNTPPITGDYLLYGVYDTGFDNLGADRRHLTPDSEARGRFQWHHLQEINEEMSLQGELGIISDRNFLEQFNEREFDTGKDNENLLNFKFQRDNAAFSLLGRYMINDFDSGTSWLPAART